MARATAALVPHAGADRGGNRFRVLQTRARATARHSRLAVDGRASVAGDWMDLLAAIEWRARNSERASSALKEGGGWLRMRWGCFDDMVYSGLASNGTGGGGGLRRPRSGREDVLPISVMTQGGARRAATTVGGVAAGGERCAAGASGVGEIGSVHAAGIGMIRSLDASADI